MQGVGQVVFGDVPLEDVFPCKCLGADRARVWAVVGLRGEVTL